VSACGSKLMLYVDDGMLFIVYCPLFSVSECVTNL